MADLENVKRALFFAMMVVVPYVAHRLRRSGATRAAKEYPALATKLGLSRRDPAKGGIGALSGELDGHRVFVDPDDRPRIVVYARTEPKVVLRTYEHEKRVPAGKVAVAPGEFPSGFVKEAYAAPESAPALEARASELAALLRPFAARWPRAVSHLSITPERLECALDFGRPSHIPPEVVEKLLPAAVSVVRFFESLPDRRSG
jgi:hypothetical protein